jgi:hypothetical protein
VTDERLHEMMADPGPAPTHDANGWPTDVASPARGDCADSLFEDCVDGGGGTVYRVECPHGRWLERVRAGRALYRANRWHGFADTTNPPTAYHAPDMPAESPAGPASSSASPSGTGGPNPAYASANGWPIDSPPAPVTADGEVHTPSLFVPTSADQAPTTWVCRTCTVKDFMPVWPCAAVAEVYEAGASLSGTGGLAEVDALLARLEAATRALTTHTQTLRELLTADRAQGGEPRD